MKSQAFASRFASVSWPHPFIADASGRAHASGCLARFSVPGGMSGQDAGPIGAISFP